MSAQPLGSATRAAGSSARATLLAAGITRSGGTAVWPPAANNAWREARGVVGEGKRAGRVKITEGGGSGEVGARLREVAFG